MQEKQETYQYNENAGNEMLVKIVVTLDGRGQKEKGLSLKELLKRYKDPEKAKEIDEAIEKRMAGKI